MNPPFFQTRVEGQEDMTRVEDLVAASLGGENGKCSFLRSHAFQALRMAALYFPERAPLRADHGPTGLSVSLQNNVVGLAWMGPIESVASFQDALVEFKPHPAALEYKPQLLEEEDRARWTKARPALSAEEELALSTAGPDELKQRFGRKNRDPGPHPRKRPRTVFHEPPR